MEKILSLSSIKEMARFALTALGICLLCVIWLGCLAYAVSVFTNDPFLYGSLSALDWILGIISALAVVGGFMWVLIKMVDA